MNYQQRLAVAPEAITKLLESSQRLHAELVRSPLWELVKTEPVILQWMAALADVESIIKPKPPEEEKLYGSKS